MIEDPNEAASTEQELREDKEDAQLRSDAKADVLAGARTGGAIKDGSPKPDAHADDAAAPANKNK